MISPGKTIGILGGGALGRMLAQAAQSLGYRVHVFEPNGPSPAGAVAHREVNASYEDLAALKEFVRDVDLVTSDFENIPLLSLEMIASLVPLLPRAEVLHVCQNRKREKDWLGTNGFPHVRYAEALAGEIASAVAQVGRPCVVKTADFGSDGRGQMKITDESDLEKAEAIFRGRRCVVERWLDYSAEIAVIVARSAAGELRPFPVVENIHTRDVLDIAIAPARVSETVRRDAGLLATAITEKLGVVGLLAVEMFVTPGGEVLVNELAPRPHNSGHWSLDGCETSQFEQHLRAVCGLPLGGTGVREPTVMVNILGDDWRPKEGRLAGTPNWSAVLAEPRAKLHLYGLCQARPGSKMGHFTVRDADIDTALATARAIKARL